MRAPRAFTLERALIALVVAIPVVGYVLVRPGPEPGPPPVATSPPPEMLEAASRAEASPLFAADEPIRLRLRSDIGFLRHERPDDEEIPGVVRFVDLDREMSEVEIEVRTRGISRRSAELCNFPLLRLDFPRSQVEGTVFEGQDKLRLVTPCNDSLPEARSYVLLEYLVYRTFNMVTPVSPRVRRVEITFEDAGSGRAGSLQPGFLIESDEMLAERLLARPVDAGEGTDVPRLDPRETDSEYGALMAVFQYMIGNTDWSSLQFHNVKLLETWDGRRWTVPYDFDGSGAVDADYAVPDPSLPIETVTERLFRGFCFDELRDRESMVERFGGVRDEVYAMYRGLDGLEAERAEEALRFYDGFYEVLDAPREWERRVVRACR